MRIDAVSHQGTVGSWHGGRISRAAWSGRRAIGGAGVAIARANAIGSLGRLIRLGRVGVTTKTGALEEMLFLSRGILCTNLLAVDALDGEALEDRNDRNGSRMLMTGSVVVGLKYYEIRKSRTLSSSLARNSTNAACTSWSTVRPMMGRRGGR